MNDQENQTKQDGVFVSYAWKAENETAVVDRLEKACENRAIRLLRDKNEIKYKESILEYMKKLGVGNYIILVLSDAYLKSRFCMFELLTIHEHKQFHKRVFPIFLYGLNISDAKVRSKYRTYWKNQYKELDEELKKGSLHNADGELKDLKLYHKIQENMSHLTTILSDMNALTEEIHVKTDFEVLIDSILSTLESDDKNQRRKEEINKFKEKIKTEIKEFFKEKKQTLFFVTFRKILIEKVVDKVENKCSDCFLIDKFIDLKLFDQISVLGMVYDQCQQKIKKHDEYDFSCLVDGWHFVTQILGRIVLSAVNDDWCERNRDKSCLENGMSIEIAINSQYAHEIIFSRINEVCANFNKKDPESYLGKQIGPAFLEIESGWDISDIVNTIKIIMLKQIAPEITVTEKTIGDHDEYLDERLLICNEDNEPRFLPLYKDDEKNPLSHQQVLSQLKEDLPSLNFILVTENGESEILIVREKRLSARLDAFFKKAPKSFAN